MSTANNYLEQLENEAIYILRETAAQFEKPALPTDTQVAHSYG